MIMKLLTLTLSLPLHNVPLTYCTSIISAYYEFCVEYETGRPRIGLAFIEFKNRYQPRGFVRNVCLVEFAQTLICYGWHPSLLK
jgi:hypothetical protein